MIFRNPTFPKKCRKWSKMVPKWPPKKPQNLRFWPPLILMNFTRGPKCSPMTPNELKMTPNDSQMSQKWPQMAPKRVQMTPKWPQMIPKWSQIAPNRPQMSPKWSRMTEKDPKLPNTISKMIPNHLKMIPNDSKWFQMIPNDSKWFQITSKWFLPCLACTCCTHSVCAHMLGLFALAQRVFTCLSLLHSFNLCSRAGAYCPQSRFPFLALQVSIGIEPLATSYHYLLWGGAL